MFVAKNLKTVFPLRFKSLDFRMHRSLDPPLNQQNKNLNWNKWELVVAFAPYGGPYPILNLFVMLELASQYIPIVGLNFKHFLYKKFVLFDRKVIFASF